MPRYVATIPSAWPAERTFAYMADFRNAAEWDPSVVSATSVEEGPVHEGSVFDLCIRSGKRVAPFRYRVVALEPRRIVLRATTQRFVSTDRITVRDDGEGSEIIYDAFLTARGVLRLANPLIGATFRRMGDAACQRLTGVVSH